jgi:prevent-host-death family protein
MDKTITDENARQEFDQILDGVTRKGEQIVIERDGEPVAAVVPFLLYEQWKHSWDSFFDRIEQMARNADMDEDEAMALALEAQQAVRAEQRKMST